MRTRPAPTFFFDHKNPFFLCRRDFRRRQSPRTAADADAIIEARPTGASWRRPRPFRPDFVAQLAARPPLRDPHDATRFHASPSSPGGAEPCAQLLTGALASYACHEALTGEDVRPTNRDLTRH